MNNKIYTAIATPNIALIKYWGKRGNKALNLPYNSSVSLTLHKNALYTKTSVVFSPKFKEDKVYIDGQLQDVKSGNEKTKALLHVLKDMRKLAGVEEKALIVSKNTFPASSGLASSASGAAAMVFALNAALSLKLNKKELSILARKISGSACRSLIGGFVLWKKGQRTDGKDSYAMQIASPSHWKIVDIIGIVSKLKKKVSSSRGHLITPKTSVLYSKRPEFAERNSKAAVQAIKKKDFESLARIIMRDSNNMHATMLDSWPPIRYMNDKSWSIVEAVHDMNERFGKAIAAYTFDAGPNVHLITTAKYKKEVKNMLAEILGSEEKVIVASLGNGPALVEKASLINKSLHPIFK